MISVIVPIYNVEDYLPHCLDSLLAQTYQDLQIILIDDGSTDNSGNICDEYVRKDARFMVIHQSNHGISEARNKGLEYVNGDYVYFIDGDDYIHPQMLETLFQALHHSNYGFAMVDFKRVWDFKIEEIHENCKRISISQDELFKQLFNHSPSKLGLNEIHFHVVWNKLYRKDLIKEIKFIITGCEDAEFNNKVFFRTLKAIYIDAPLYYWFQRSSSITHQPFNRINLKQIHSYYTCLNEIPLNKIEYRAACLEKLYKTMINRRFRSKYTKYKKECLSIIKDVKQKTIKEFIGNTHISLKMKIVLLIFYYFPTLYFLYMYKTGNTK